jgi:hypothetical protein
MSGSSDGDSARRFRRRSRSIAQLEAIRKIQVEKLARES